MVKQERQLIDVPVSILVRKHNLPKASDLGSFRQHAEEYVLANLEAFYTIRREGRDVITRLDNGHTEIIVGFGASSYASQIWGEDLNIFISVALRQKLLPDWQKIVNSLEGRVAKMEI